MVLLPECGNGQPLYIIKADTLAKLVVPVGIVGAA
jgi:hypothetical protein